MDASTERSAGFTLIELLVVILVMAVLAAVAIPVFLQQRMAGYQAAARHDLRHLAEQQELRLHDRGSYGSGTQLDGTTGAVSVSDGVQLRVVAYEGGHGFCLSARHVRTSTTWSYDSLAGGQQDADVPCPTSYATTDGQLIP